MIVKPLNPDTVINEVAVTIEHVVVLIVVVPSLALHV